MSAADVVVIGGGLAGLTAARELKRRGATAVVLEARDRVGGRTLSQEMGGQTIDLGGQWIGPGQERMAALVKELGLSTFPTYCKGKKILDVRGEISTYEGTIPRLSPIKLGLLQLALSRAERLLAKITPGDPMGARGAEELDLTTLASWQRRLAPSRDVRELFDVAVRVIFGAEASELSLLYFLHYARAGGGLMHLVEIEKGAQQDRFREGAQSVSLALAERLGDAVVLGAAVRRLERNDDGVIAHTDKGDFHARFAVVAIPPSLSAKIEHAPALPPLRSALEGRMAMGATIKCLARYERPFWRARGLSGEVASTGGPVTVVFDNSPESGASGALLGFVVGKPARELQALSAEERKRLVLQAFGRFFGPEAERPLEYRELDWSTEEHTGGCPTSTMGPGTLSIYGSALRAPVGRVHWAGTETATEWCGYMEGAVESGERAAREIAGRLG